MSQASLLESLTHTVDVTRFSMAFPGLAKVAIFTTNVSAEL